MAELSSNSAPAPRAPFDWRRFLANVAVAGFVVGMLCPFMPPRLVPYCGTAAEVLRRVGSLQLPPSSCCAADAGVRVTTDVVEISGAVDGGR